MDVYRPLRAGLFFYECLRLLLLFVFLYVTSMGNGFNVRSFPYLVYFSSNALFPLIVLFVWLRPEEYRNYLNLYIAGKIIVLVTFYIWQILSTRGFWGLSAGPQGEFSGTAENLIMSVFLLWGSVIVSLTDVLSLWGSWMLKSKFRQVNGGQK